jgi:hypothetical protein
MNGSAIKKNLIYLLFIATIFYFAVGKIFKVVKFNKLTQLNKGIYFSTFILLFYFFYKVIPVLLFRNSNITEGMTLADSLMSGGKSSETGSSDTDTGSSGNSGTSIDYTKGWDTADNFRDNYCSKTPIFVDGVLFEDNTGNDYGGLVYGLKGELYDSATKKPKKELIDAFTSQSEKGVTIDVNSFIDGCITNLKADKNKKGGSTQMCNPKCNFKFTSPNKK